MVSGPEIAQRSPLDRCVFVTRRIPEAGLVLLREGGAEVVIGEVDETRLPSREVVRDGGGKAAVLLPLLTETVDREFLEGVPHLRGVANYAVGFNNIDVVAATELGIPVSNTPGILTDTTADMTWALILAVARRIPEGDRYVREGRFRTWGPNLLLGTDVSPGGSGVRKTLGILGLGRIGEAVARRASGFEMDILAASSRGDGSRVVPAGIEWVEVEELLERSDFLTIHLPLTAETHHFIDETKLRRMKSTAFIVNTSRGPVIDENALVRALREGWIAGAALDVFEEEPDLAPGLAELENVVLAPHTGSASRDTRSRMAVIAATNALHHLRGERAPNVVNPEVYESEAWRIRVGANDA
jgi:glyoxylate reductase